jgi:hypothetical protein
LLCGCWLHTRGRELPGNYNHVLLAELFHFQSRRWRQIAVDHIELVHKALKSFIITLSEHITYEDASFWRSEDRSTND